MSRIGRKPIEIPSGVEVKLEGYARLQSRDRKVHRLGSSSRYEAWSLITVKFLWNALQTISFTGVCMAQRAVSSRTW